MNVWRKNALVRSAIVLEKVVELWRQSFFQIEGSKTVFFGSNRMI